MKWIVALLALANLALLLPPASAGRVAGALLLLGLLPGLAWTGRWLPGSSPLLRWTVAAALSYVFTGLAALLLHYLPGPVQTWQLLLVLNLLTLLPIAGPPRGGQALWRWEDWKIALLGGRENRAPGLPTFTPPYLRTALLPLLLILILALLLRGVNLGYSEFQGDEALVMIAAAEALSGHEDALWLRSKGPAEVLLPMALWQLSGSITEPIARLPFTIASLWAIVTVYLIGRRLGGPTAGWLAAGFFAFSGFSVAFGRIVQYQALVLWFSSLAWLLAAEWLLTGRKRLAFLAGLSLGLGLLAHYDAILVLPAIAWLLLAGLPEQRRPDAARLVLPALLFGLALLLVALPFYLPFLLDPQAQRTGDYVGQRIGSELRNNLPDFFHFNTFYSSAYYIIITGLLVLGLLAAAIWRAGRRSIWLPAAVVAAILAVVLAPDLPAVAGLNLAALPFALALLAAGLGFNRRRPGGRLWQALLAWLAVPFLGYNFVVALGLTHIYTIVPAWSLLAGLAWFHLFHHARAAPPEDTPARRPFAGLSTSLSPYLPTASSLLLLLLLGLSTVFLWNAFIRHDVEYWQDYPAGNLAWYWNPYDRPPEAGFFGFAHRTGWKAVGQKIISGELAGDYGSNEEPDVTTWYTRGAPRACDPRPEFYFLASDLIDPVEVPADLIVEAYEQIGQITLPNQKQLTIMQQRPVTHYLAELPEQLLARQFDQTATPPAFARSARGARPAGANFSGLVRLSGYHLDTRRAYPGGRVAVTLYWQALAPLPASYHVFVHLVGAEGPAAQADGVPVCWSYPTDRWRPGQIIADQHAIAIPPDLPPGDYPLQVGLYLAESFTRLDVLDEAGHPAGAEVTLAVVEIRD